MLEEKAPSAEPQPPQGEPERPDDADAGDAFMFEEIPLAELQPEKEAPGRSAAPEARETMEVPRDRPAPFTAGTAAAEAAPAPSGTPPFAMHEERPKPEVPEHKTSTFESLAERLEFEVPESFLTQPTPPADIGQADHVRFRQRKTEWPEIPRPAAPFPEFVPPSHAEARFRRRDDERTTRAVPGSAGPAGRPASPFDEVPGKPSGKRIPEPPPTPKAPPVSPAAVEEALRQAAAEAKPEPAPPPPAREAPTPRLEDESLEAERLDERYGRLDRAQRRRWPWAVGLGILLGILWVQVAYLFRDEITRTWPQLRPAYLFVCEYLGCTLELSRVAGAVHIETSDLLSDPKVPGSFTLNAVVRNGAPYPQAFPYLELTLTDARDRPVVRRALSPDEWVPAEKLERGFLAGEEIVVHLPFHAPDVEAVGYRIYAFYP